MARRNYQEEAEKLAIATDIAIKAIKSCPPKDFKDADIQHFVQTYSDWTEEVLNPRLQYRNLASLKHSVTAVFTYFQESTGPTVECFWNELNQLDLGYKRVDPLQKILKRGKIKGQIEYECVVDTMISAQQEGRINQEELDTLLKYIADFENK